MNNKSQGLSINVIIIVAIALIVLVVLIAIFTGRLGGFVEGVNKAQSCSSSCTAIGKTFSASDKADSESCAKTEGRQFFPGEFSDANNDCCCTP